MTGVSYIHCCPEDHEPIPDLSSLPFYTAGGSKAPGRKQRASAGPRVAVE